ncbi:substrate-binding periplasmic protein [Xylophilus sp.]|uniref:substrate-binding periplasmic protein n=1 Tax=Xylophilus sp. TaxID=2653893 RepID=UPI0013BA92BD|nr:transporter substrate-binding domain-containing protein [Xylophilus sp.]KAF1045351.1 MAG: Membrane-bound lytic murein transglycosylase F [Xylophilus sp.]
MTSTFPCAPRRRPSAAAAALRRLALTFTLALAGLLPSAALTAAPAGAAAATTSAPAPAAPAPVAHAPVSPNALGSVVRLPDGRLLAPDIARIVTRGELGVAMLNVDTPPFFSFDDQGRWSGLEVNLAQSIADELGVKLRVNRDAATFNAVVDLIARGEADIAISKLSRTLGRTQTIAFSAPYLTLNHALILNRVKFAQLARGRPLPEVVRSFDGSIGVIAKSSFAYYARRNFPKAKIEEFPTWNDVLAAVFDGSVTAAYRDEFEVKRVLKADPTVALALRTVMLKDLEDTLGVGVSVADPNLLAFVNEFLAQRTEKLDITRVLQALDK